MFVMVTAMVAMFGSVTGAAASESEAEKSARYRQVLERAERLSLVNASSRPLDRPFEEIEREEELLAFRHTTGFADAERVEITEYVGAKSGRLYACRLTAAKPRECLEIIIARK
jgi:hypothetical protein